MASDIDGPRTVWDRSTLDGTTFENAKLDAAGFARDPLAIVVPCHRIIGADGSLTGYAGGLERKRALLALEADGAILRLAA